MFNTFWITSRWAMLPLLFGMIIINTFIPDFYWNSELFHVLIENGGSLIGFGLALIVLAMINKQQLSVNYIWLIAAFISMSTLDMFHSQIHPSQVFVWLHSVATFIGGLFAMLIWLPESLSKKFFKPFYFWLILLISIGFSIFSILMPDLILIMLDANKQFTSSADALNIMGGFGFLITWLYFVKEYHRHHHAQLFFFANHFALFGIAGLLFGISFLWDANWWFWHMIRAFAYLFLIFRFSSIYRKSLKLAEKSLANNEAKFRGVLESSLVGVLMVNEQGEIVLVNDSLCDMTGYLENELIGEKIEKLVPISFSQHKQWRDDYLHNPETRVMASGKVFNALRKDGKEFPAEVSLTPVKTEQGVVVTAMLQDITKRIEAEHERERLLKDLSQKNEELERFTYTVSHDLKSPLVTITGFIGLLKKDIADNNKERVEADFTRISDAANVMQELLDDVLELSRIGRQESAHSEVSVEDSVKAVIEMLTVKINSSHAVITVEPDLPTVTVEEVRFKEILLNLIENSIKYGKENVPPEITIGVRKDKKYKNKVVFFVKDNGIGIDARYHNKIFGLFERLSNDDKGTGVGLAIVKRIVEVHGGKIWVESGGLGSGSTFNFSILKI